jgi:hypothetical protein
MNNRFDIPAINPPTPPPDTTSSIDDVPITLSTFLEAPATAIPSPAATPKDVGDDMDSGTEVEAPSISDWEPTSENGEGNGWDGPSEREVCGLSAAICG